MKVAMLVGTLLFTFVSGFYQFGALDLVASPDNQAVQSCEDSFPPPPSWP
jgi:hypothetical protein